MRQDCTIDLLVQYYITWDKGTTSFTNFWFLLCSAITIPESSLSLQWFEPCVDLWLECWLCEVSSGWEKRSMEVWLYWELSQVWLSWPLHNIYTSNHNMYTLYQCTHRVAVSCGGHRDAGDTLFTNMSWCKFTPNNLILPNLKWSYKTLIDNLSIKPKKLFLLQWCIYRLGLTT